MLNWMLRGSVRSRRGQKGGRGAWGLRKEDEVFLRWKKMAMRHQAAVKWNMVWGVKFFNWLVVSAVFLFFLTNMVVFLRFSINSFFHFVSHLMITMAACDSLFVFFRFSKHSKFRPIFVTFWPLKNFVCLFVCIDALL